MRRYMTLEELTLQNVGGFRRSQFDVDSNRLLVGQNNAGKTTLLRTLVWLLTQADARLFEGRRALSPAESALLVPSQKLGGKARELVVALRVHDGRVARKFGVAKAHRIELFILFRSSGPIVRFSRLKRGQVAESEALALELLRRLQAEYHITYVPAPRGAAVSDQLSALIASRLIERYESAAPGRPSSDVSKFRAARDLIEAASDSETSTLIGELVKMAPVNIPLEAHVLAEAGSLIRGSSATIPARISFGEPGQQQVPLASVGSGSVSLLELAAHQMLARVEGKRHLMLIEEPEAFLHPTAQELVGQWLYQAADRQVIATSHSPAVAFQAKPSAIRVVHDHAVFRPRDVDPLQDDKDTWLHSTAAAPSLFLPSLLLVEGPGEVAFFTELKSRLRGIFGDHVVSAMGVEAAGSNTQFAPWVRYLTRFQSQPSGDSPVNFLVLADSRDSGKEVSRVAKECPWAIQTPAREFSRLADGIAADDFTTSSRDVIAQRTSDLNRDLDRRGDPVMLSVIDLEYSMLSALSDERASLLGRTLGIEEDTRDDLLRRLGSKGGGAKPSEGASKAPYVRRLLAQALDWTEVSEVYLEVLWRWARNTGRIDTRPPELRVP